MSHPTITLPVPHARPSTRLGSLLSIVWYLALTTLYQRYCGSLIGFGWSLLNPALTIGVYYLAFAVFIRVPIENFFVYLVSGLLPWLFFSSALTGSTNSLIARSHSLNTSTVNRLMFIFADTTIELVTLLTSLVVLMIFAAAIVHTASWHWLLLPLLILPLVVTTYALTVCIAYYSVVYRDIPHLLQVGLGVFFWLLPIVYHWSMLPEPFDRLVQYNPIALLISPLQVALHGGMLPSLGLMLGASAVACLAVLAALYCYRRRNREIIFYL